MGNWGGKSDKKSINEKPPNRWGGWGGKPKDHKCRYCQWKNLPTWTKDKEGKTETGGGRRDVILLIRNLDNKRFSQNKVLYCSSGVKLPIVKPPMQVSWCSLHQGDRSPATYQLLALEPQWLGFLLVVSSLSPHLARFLAYPVGCPHICFAESWIVGLAIGGVESRGADVAVSFSGWSL